MRSVAPTTMSPARAAIQTVTGGCSSRGFAAREFSIGQWIGASEKLANQDHRTESGMPVFRPPSRRLSGNSSIGNLGRCRSSQTRIRFGSSTSLRNSSTVICPMPRMGSGGLGAGGLAGYFHASDR